MKQIELSKSRKHKGKYITYVDDIDYEYLNQFSWIVVKSGSNRYAARYIKENGKNKIIYMHRELMNAVKGLVIDHKDRNGLNNQKENLREVSHSINLHNSASRCGSVYKGVHTLIRKTPKNVNYRYWISSITINNKVKYLGSFPYTKEGEIFAAKAYNNEAIKAYGNNAILNNI